MLKKLCAVLLFVFVASLFVAGSAFAALDGGVRVSAADIGGLPDRVQKLTMNPGSADFLSDDWMGTISAEAMTGSLYNSADVFAVISVGGQVAYMSADVANSLMSDVIPSTLTGAAGQRDRFVRQMNAVWRGRIPAVKDLGIAAFLLEDEFNGKKASEIFAVKARSATKKEAYTMVYAASDLVNKKSAIEKRKAGETTVLLGADDIVGADEEAEYYLVVVVEDNLDAGNGFDIMKSFDFVGDPSFVIASNPLVRHNPNIFGRPTGATFRQAVVGRRYVVDDPANNPPTYNTVQLHRAVTDDFNSNMLLSVTDRRNTGFRYLKPSIITQFGLTDATKVQELPAYNVVRGIDDNTLATGDVTVVLFYLDPKFEGLKASDVKVATARVDANNQVIRKDFTQVYAPLDLADGTSAVLKTDGAHQVVLGENDPIGAGYFLAICVKDDSAFDLADDNMCVVVAPVVYTEGGSTPVEPTNPFVAVPSISGLPAGLATPTATVVHANLTETGLTTAAQGAVDTAGTEVNGGVQYYMSSSVASAILAAHEADLGKTPVSQHNVPVMKAALPAGTSAAAFAFQIASSFVDKTVGDVKFYKAVNGTAADAKEFDLVQAGDKMENGKFAIVTSAGVVKTASEKVAAGDLVVYAIADGGDFDLDGSVNGSVSDPVLVACDNTAAPTSGGSGSSGGCSVGGFAPATLLLLAPLFLLLKK